MKSNNHFLKKWQTKILFTVSLFFIVVLSACSGDSQVNNPQATKEIADADVAPKPKVYTGVPAESDSILRFQTKLWNQLAFEGRCIDCHDSQSSNPQTPYFMESSNINEAYRSVLGLNSEPALVDLENIENSRLISKVGTPHNCWSDFQTGIVDTGVCVSQMTTFINSWAAQDTTSTNEILLKTPEDSEKPVRDSKSFPQSPASFQSTVYSITGNPSYCAQCHREGTEVNQQPYIGSENINVAYQAAKVLLNLDEPEDSTLALRVEQELHGCWTNCASDSNAIVAQIEAFANQIEDTPVNENLVKSFAMDFAGATPTSGGGRVNNGVIALYKFEEGQGSVVNDTAPISEIDPTINSPLNLTISGDVEWLGSFGLKINNGKAQALTTTSERLRNLIIAGGNEFSIEAWVVPENVSQDGPARVVTLSGSADSRNFTLGQTLYNYNFAVRNSNTDANAMPLLSTPDADEVLQPTLQHVVATFSSLEGKKIYVNGELIIQDEEFEAVNLSDWDDTFSLVLGSEADNQDVWKGIYRLVAIYNRVLPQEDVISNYDAGVGQKFFLLFNVSDQVDMSVNGVSLGQDANGKDLDEAYIVFEAQQFDNYSYLFNAPFFISLNKDAVPTGDIRISGIRLGVNGQEAPLGQAYANVDMTINQDNYVNTGVFLSTLGTILPLSKGTEDDEFFVTFDALQNNIYNRPEENITLPNVSVVPTQRSNIGLKNFGEVNASLSAITGVDAKELNDIYQIVKQQLPVSEDIEGFLASHQAGVMQLAVAYCNKLVEQEKGSNKKSYFDDFDFNIASAQAFNAQGRSNIITPLLKGMNASGVDTGSAVVDLNSQPVPEDIEMELNNLIDEMGSADTATIVTAVCASAIGSAAMLLQ